MAALSLAIGIGANAAVVAAQTSAETTEQEVANKIEALEFDEIVVLLRVGAGTTVADVGTGGGAWAFRLARRVGATGRVFATDVKASQIGGIAEEARSRGVTNLTAVVGSQHDTGLPNQCCDAMLLRLVYHAFKEPALMREGMQKAVKPGGLLLVIDFRPSVESLVEDMRASGFERVRVIERWRGQADLYAVLFERLP